LKFKITGVHQHVCFSVLPSYFTQYSLLNTFCNWLGGTLSGPKSPVFRHTSHIFFDRSAATACKNLLRLAKSGRFFVSDATTLTSYTFF
jgi:hypothetical protein